MQKHEVFLLQIVVVVASLIFGLWLSFALAGHFGFASALAAVQENVLLVWGLIPGVALAVVLAKACREYMFNGFEGYRYERFIRGVRMENSHHLSNRIRRHNRKLTRSDNRRRKRARRKHRTELTPLGSGSGDAADRPAGAPEVPANDDARKPVSVCGVEMPMDIETRNLLVVGTVGTGKSVAINGLIASALDRGDRMVTVDPNGSLVSRFFLPGDVILNPYDARSAGWSLFNEAYEGFDFDRVAQSAIPPQITDQAEEWAGFARYMLADAMKQLDQANMQDMHTLVSVLVREARPILKKLIESSDSIGFFGADAEKATASALFTLNKYIRPLRQVTDGDFSIRRWIGDENGGNIWITWREDQRTALAPLIPVWIDLVFAMILSEAPTFDRRLWVNLDELASLGRLYSFEAAVSKGRKHGLCVAGGLQDIVQLTMMLGKLPAEAALACFRSYLVLGGANAQTTEAVSVMLGEHEVERHPLGVQGNWKANTRERRHERERIVLPSEIANLPDLQGYLKYGTDWPLTKIKFNVRDFPVRHPEYVGVRHSSGAVHA